MEGKSPMSITTNSSSGSNNNSSVNNNSTLGSGHGVWYPTPDKMHTEEPDDVRDRKESVSDSKKKGKKNTKKVKNFRAFLSMLSNAQSCLNIYHF